ncbi:MAG: FAD-binding protein [Bacteroidetes bacterium]|nr:FAD-binding protein [Bacteroidota bacterium]
MIIHKTGNKKWINRHETFEQPISDLYDLANRDTGDVLADYNDTTTSIQGIIQQAINAGTTIRVLGGEWSWTKIAATNGILLNTKPLNLSFKIGQQNLSPACNRSPEEFYFSQCGTSVKELSDRLRKRNRSLKTSGASNGQTIVGAMSTGTHGSAIDVGSIQDCVVGLHIIVSPVRHVWLERKSNPIVSQSFVSNLHATLIQDDSLFNAALVSFGSFGFIHGVLIETDPLFLYRSYRLKVESGDDLYELMETLDFGNTSIALPFGNERPYHFQTLINQYDSKNQAYLTAMYKRPYNTTYTPPALTGGFAPGDDGPSFIGAITQAIPALVPSIVNALISSAYAPYSNVWGTHGEIFSNTDTHGKVLSSATGVPLNYVNKVRLILLELNKTKGPFAGVIAFRYVKGTQATLGFTKFPITCIVELDGVFSNESYRFYDLFWNELFAQNIPFTFHWGKLLKLDNPKVRTLYTAEKVNEWLAARKKVMVDPLSMRVFTNDLMVEWGLDTLVSEDVVA